MDKKTGGWGTTWIHILQPVIAWHHTMPEGLHVRFTGPELKSGKAWGLVVSV